MDPFKKKNVTITQRLYILRNKYNNFALINAEELPSHAQFKFWDGYQSRQVNTHAFQQPEHAYQNRKEWH